MIVYLDVYFAVNALMNYLLLVLTRQIIGAAAAGRVRGGPLRRGLRVIAAAAFGALWSCAWLYLPPKVWWVGSAWSWVVAGSVMLVIAFGRCSMPVLGKELLMFWVLSTMAGGVFELFGQRSIGRFPLSVLLCIACGLGLAGHLLAGVGRDWLRMRRCLYEATLRYQGREKTLPALWDTGNQLYEPYSHQPVHVITYEACRGLCDRVPGVIYIPFHSVGAEYGMLPGIQIDEMEVAQGGKLIRRFEKPWLAVSRKSLSTGHQYEMLLHGEQE
ncbi:MAG: sigma-E processing peptidase SpoIIGA [Lachnospiraceae bacterium]|nr:sigma-E processing peptidase SpoIIGA [Lachnospiraceae bacterium]